MNLSEKEEEEIYEWGITFFEMGWDACLQFITKSGNMAKSVKAEAVRNYIEEKKREQGK